MKIEEIRSSVAGLRDEITELADAETLTEEQELRFEAAMTEFEARKAELVAAEERAAKIEAVRSTVTERTAGSAAPSIIRKSDPADLDLRTASRGELRSAAMRVLESDGSHLSARQGDHVEALLRKADENTDGASIARRLLVTETDSYRSAFLKATTQAQPVFTAEEARSINEFRAANEGTGSAGGFGVPVLIDPTIILTSGASNAPILDVAKTVTITTNAWKGVSSAAVSWSYDAEATAVSDDSTTLAQPTITAYKAQGFIPYSIELGEDYPSFAEEMSMLLNQGFIDLLASQTVIGSGSSSPKGIFTAMQNVTTNPAHVTVKTSGSLGAVDIRKAWAALPQRFRANARWVMSPGVMAQVRAFGNGQALSDFTVNMLADGADQLTGRPVITSDYAPDFTGTTGTASYAVVGDFSNFVVVQRAGMTVELVNHLLDTSTGRPTGQRGWYARARHGFDAVNVNGFRLISNS